MKLEGFKKIIIEDFSSDEQKFISKLAYAINPFMDSVAQFANKNVTFQNNINASIKTFKVTVSSGVPTTTIKIQSGLSSSCKGIWVIRARNLTDTTNLSGAPFVTFTESEKILTINHITGLPNSKEFELTIIMLGQE